MPSSSSIAELIADLAVESDSERALRRITNTARELTGSRNSLIAVLNEDLGHLEVRFSSGESAAGNPSRKSWILEISQDEALAGYVAATGSSMITSNEGNLPRFKRIFQSTESEIGVPIRDRHGRVLAVLNVETDKSRAYTEDSRETIQTLANLAAIVIEQEKHIKREEALLQIGSSLRAVSEEALVEAVMFVAKDILRLQACSIFLLDPKIDRFVLCGTVGWLKEEVGRIHYARGEGFTGWVGDTGQSIYLDDPQNDPRWRGKYVEIPSDQIASFLAVPIIIRNKSIGVIRVLRKKPDNPFLDNRFTEDDVRMMRSIAAQVATGLENVRNVQSVIRNERMIAWGELSAKSSHMIGNRIFALKGDLNELSHIIKSGKILESEVKVIHESLVTNLKRVEEILQDFRDFLTATQLETGPENLNHLIEETAMEVFPRRSSIQLELQLDPNLPSVEFDSKRLRRALSELIENAINHMGVGKLRIATRISEPVADLPGSTETAEIEISDTGPGVEGDQKNLIFQPFFSKRVKGMGLGLSIVKGIIDAHGGEVFESGVEGEGAKFIIRLPFSELRP